MRNIPRELWSAAHHWLIHHGRRVSPRPQPPLRPVPPPRALPRRKAAHRRRPGGAGRRQGPAVTWSGLPSYGRSVRSAPPTRLRPGLPRQDRLPVIVPWRHRAIPVHVHPAGHRPPALRHTGHLIEPSCARPGFRVHEQPASALFHHHDPGDPRRDGAVHVQPAVAHPVVPEGRRASGRIAVMWRSARTLSGSWGNPRPSINATAPATCGAANEVPVPQSKPPPVFSVSTQLPPPPPGATRSRSGPPAE